MVYFKELPENDLAEIGTKKKDTKKLKKPWLTAMFLVITNGCQIFEKNSCL